jgi:hypothetical protein
MTDVKQSPDAVDVDRKRDMILAHEMRFARHLAYRVVDTPKLHIWMILIPVIFVYHFFNLNRAKEARQGFVEGFMISRRQALDAVWESMRGNRGASSDKILSKEMLDGLCAASAVPRRAMDKYRAFIELLADHYIDLMLASGNTYEELVRRVYQKRSNYLLFLNQLNTAERALNTALKPHLSKEVQGAREVMASMEKSMIEIRREQAESIFA